MTAQLVALTGRLWLETHVADPALRAQTHTLTALTSMNIDEEEVGMYQDFLNKICFFTYNILARINTFENVNV